MGELNFSHEADLETNCLAALTTLHESLGFKLWMITRTDGLDCIVLHSYDQYYNVVSGKVFRWLDSLCSRMVRGEAPNIAPVTEETPAYSSAAMAKIVPIKAYIGVPLTYSDGSLFGTLCAIDPEPQSPEIINELPTIQYAGANISKQMNFELESCAIGREAQRLKESLSIDIETGIENDLAWEMAVQYEEHQAAMLGSPLAVAVVEMPYRSTPNQLRLAAQVIRESLLPAHPVARIGKNHFGIIFVDCSQIRLVALSSRLRTTLADREIRANIGIARRDPSKGLFSAVRDAIESCKGTTSGIAA